jgi:hypothetical protein
MSRESDAELVEARTNEIERALLAVVEQSFCDSPLATVLALSRAWTATSAQVILQRPRLRSSILAQFETIRLVVERGASDLHIPASKRPE